MARVVVTGDADLSATAGAPPTSSNTNNGRALYREPGQPRKPQHMMYDRRVVRGNTYAAPVIPSVRDAPGKYHTNGAVLYFHARAGDGGGDGAHSKGGRE